MEDLAQLKLIRISVPVGTGRNSNAMRSITTKHITHS